MSIRFTYYGSQEITHQITVRVRKEKMHINRLSSSTVHPPPLFVLVMFLLMKLYAVSCSGLQITISSQSYTRCCCDVVQLVTLWDDQGHSSRSRFLDLSPSLQCQCATCTICYTVGCSESQFPFLYALLLDRCATCYTVSCSKIHFTVSVPSPVYAIAVSMCN